jgi:hypothetical protein
MHPLILHQLATDRVNDMIATAAGSRWARQARRTRRAPTPGRRTQPGLPGTQPGLPPAASPTRPAPSPACVTRGSSRGVTPGIADERAGALPRSLAP